MKINGFPTREYTHQPFFLYKPFFKKETFEGTVEW